MPRHQEFTVEQVIAALEKAMGLKTQAARLLGCHPATVEAYAQRYESVKRCLKYEREKFVDAAEAALYSAVISKEAWAVTFALATIGKDRGYVRREEQVHKGDKENPVEVKVSNPDAIRAAEDAYARSTGAESVHLGVRESNGHTSDSRALTLPSLPIPKDVSPG